MISVSCIIILCGKENCMDDSLMAAIGTVKVKITEQIAALQDDPTWHEIKKLYQGLGTLEELWGVPKTDLSALLGIAGDSTATISKYEFAGQPPLEAAKQYLRKILAKGQKAASLDDILAALEQGGLTAKRDDLRLSLSRSTTEIVKTDNDVYGLLEAFPHIKRGSPGRKKGQQANGATQPAAPVWKDEGGSEGDEK